MKTQPEFKFTTDPEPGVIPRRWGRFVRTVISLCESKRWRTSAVVALCVGLTACTSTPPKMLTTLPDFGSDPSPTPPSAMVAAEVGTPAPTPVAQPPDEVVQRVIADITADPAKVVEIVLAAVKANPAQVEAIARAAFSLVPARSGEIAMLIVQMSPTPATNAAVASAAATAAPSPMPQNVAATASSWPAPTANVSAFPSGGGAVISTDDIARIFREKFTAIPIFYATDRKPEITLDEWNRRFPSEGSDLAYFGIDRNEDEAGSHKLSYGICQVSVPKKHVATQLERPSWWQDEDSARHFTIRQLFPLKQEELRTKINQVVAKPGEKTVFVFIHGYNTSFNEAAMRLAQITADFGFLGAPILYSWSSASGKLPLPTNYSHDEKTIEATEDLLYAFLDDLVRNTGAKKINIMAHSMGNRALVAVLKKFASENRELIFNEVILAAPDVDRGVFARSAANISKLAKRVTLYVSSDDKALIASKAWARGITRLGQSGEGRFVSPVIETIDASGVDTNVMAHNYFAAASKVVADLAALITKNVGKPNEAPRTLYAAETEGKSYWRVESPQK